MTDLRLPVTAAAAEGETKLGREEKEHHGKGREGEMEEIQACNSSTHPPLFLL